LVQADLTKADEITAMIEAVRHEYGRLDVLVLNASGGLEKGKPSDYAMQLNLTAQVWVACLKKPCGSRIILAG
jgi:NAD(P)-dependent dehydrogenase (short-subunit alcohol dehydrogenase family)